MLKETYILIKVSSSKIDPDLLDKIAGRSYTLDGVEDVTASLIEENNLPKQFKENMK